MISVPSTGGISVGISVFANRGTADFHPGFDSLDVGIEPMHNICDIITPPLFQLLTFAVFPVGSPCRESCRLAQGSGCNRNECRLYHNGSYSLRCMTDILWFPDFPGPSTSYLYKSLQIVRFFRTTELRPLQLYLTGVSGRNRNNPCM